MSDEKRIATMKFVESSCEGVNCIYSHDDGPAITLEFPGLSIKSDIEIAVARKRDFIQKFNEISPEDKIKKCGGVLIECYSTDDGIKMLLLFN